MTVTCACKRQSLADDFCCLGFALLCYSERERNMHFDVVEGLQARADVVCQVLISHRKRKGLHCKPFFIQCYCICGGIFYSETVIVTFDYVTYCSRFPFLPCIRMYCSILFIQLYD